MNLYAPDYYKNFKCIADKCVHNCCIGWEIDIDEKTFDYYKNLDDDFGKKLKNNIAISDDVPHFILSDNERCPFLNSKNLCDIFTTLGENKLCSICTDHPRYRSFFDSRTEIGLGLCCEEACRIILTKKSKTKLVEIVQGTTIQTEDEDVFFAFRQTLINIVQDRTKSINERLKNLLALRNLALPTQQISEWAKLYLGLERLDENWTNYLNMLNDNLFVTDFSEDFEIAFEQISVYFIYRHLSEGFYDYRINTRIKFCVLSVIMIQSLCVAYMQKNGSLSMENLIEIARMYSSEIEYCEDNIEALFDALH